MNIEVTLTNPKTALEPGHELEGGDKGLELFALAWSCFSVITGHARIPLG